MKTLKNVICKINDFLGVVFPCILFLALFFSFVITIFARYIFHKSITWGNEVAILAYIWIMFFGCGKAMENDEHVVFSLVYDVVPPVVKMLMKIVYNANGKEEIVSLEELESSNLTQCGQPLYTK